MVDSLVVLSEVLHEVIHWPSLETEREKPGPTHVFNILIIGATGKASANPSPSQAFYTKNFSTITNVRSTANKPSTEI